MSYYDSFDYMTKQRGIVWMGPTGCGKSGLATAFLLQAIDRGHRGYFVTFPELLQELFQSLADRSEGKVLKRYLSYDCLVIKLRLTCEWVRFDLQHLGDVRPLATQ